MPRINLSRPTVATVGAYNYFYQAETSSWYRATHTPSILLVGLLATRYPIWQRQRGRGGVAEFPIVSNGLPAPVAVGPQTGRTMFTIPVDAATCLACTGNSRTYVVASETDMGSDVATPVFGTQIDFWMDKGDVVEWTRAPYYLTRLGSEVPVEAPTILAIQVGTSSAVPVPDVPTEGEVPQP